jgi:hypothetical protein
MLMPVPATMDVTPVFAMLMEPAPFVMEMAVPAVRLATTGASPVEPIRSCPFVNAADSTMDPDCETMILSFERAMNDPVPPNVTGRVPDVIFEASSEGMSAATSDLNVGAASAPAEGPLNTVFAAWFTSESVSVPVVVTGDPLTDNRDAGEEMPTLVTPVFA